MTLDKSLLLNLVNKERRKKELKLLVLDEIKKQNYDYSYVGENIGWNYENERDVVKGWMGSKGHRENILNKNYKHM
ncbi:10203_t:CDS:2, partial [Scutellospora calospora]